MQAILLVGGRGTRLQPLTDTRPKPMLPICDLPFLEHQLAHLRRHGVTRLVFACGFLPRAIMKHFGDGERVGMELEYVIEPEPLGTGGAIGFAARTVADGRVIVCNGDILTSLDLGALIRHHERSGAVGTVALTPVDDPARYGLVLTDADGAVLDWAEKQDPPPHQGNLVNAGTYVLEREALEMIPEGACSIERDVFPQLIGRGLYAHADDAYWKDIGTFPSYLAANADMLAGKLPGAGAFDGRGARSVLDRDADVSPDAVVHAPVYVGPGATVAAGATVGPHAVVSAGAELREGARAAESVVLEGAVLEREAQVVQSILGERSRVAARCSVVDGAVVAPAGTVTAPVVRGPA